MAADERFTRVPNKVVDDTKGPELAVYLTIARYAGNKSGQAFPALKTIAEESGYGITRVQQAITELEKRGHILVYPRTIKGKNARTSNLYYLPGLSPGAPPSLARRMPSGGIGMPLSDRGSVAEQHRVCRQATDGMPPSTNELDVEELAVDDYPKISIPKELPKPVRNEAGKEKMRPLAKKELEDMEWEDSCKRRLNDLRLDPSDYVKVTTGMRFMVGASDRDQRMEKLLDSVLSPAGL